MSFNDYFNKYVNAVPGASLLTNKAAQSFANNLGFGTPQATKDAEDALAQSRAAYQALDVPTLNGVQPQYASASETGPSALDDIDINPEYNDEQETQMSALDNLAKNGGRNAASDAALAQIQSQENQNAKGQNDAILANANARGMGGSGAALIAQLNSQQNQQTNQNARDLGVAGQEANTALSAGQGASGIASNLENTSYGQAANAAAANDAINKFNAGQNTGISEYNAGVGNQAQQFNKGLQQQNFQNKLSKTAGIAGTNNNATNFSQNQANMGAQQAGNILGAVTKLGAAGIGAAARGGETPGTPAVKGDSSLNDFVPINTSPREVIVPVSIRDHGTPKEIVNFVKNPPKISSNPNKDKESMLSALDNIRRRARG